MKLLMTFLFITVAFSIHGQPVYMTRTGQISFHSETSMEDIDAINNEVTSVMNIETGELVFSALIKSFRFDRALMEEHFNENYLESTKIPRASFKGKVTDMASVDFKAAGTHTVNVEGELTMHGVTRLIHTTARIGVEAGRVTAEAEFQVLLTDYKIERPKLVAEKIAESINIKVICQYVPK